MIGDGKGRPLHRRHPRQEGYFTRTDTGRIVLGSGSS